MCVCVCVTVKTTAARQHKYDVLCIGPFIDVFVLRLFCFHSFLFVAASEQSDESLQEEINKAHAVCIVYSVDDESSLDRITEHWLPLIRESINGPDDQRKPVVLVGNKVDLIDYSTIDVS